MGLDLVGADDIGGSVKSATGALHTEAFRCLLSSNICIYIYSGWVAVQNSQGSDVTHRCTYRTARRTVSYQRGD